jgi:hypothetical protein
MSRTVHTQVDLAQALDTAAAHPANVSAAVSGNLTQGVDKLPAFIERRVAAAPEGAATRRPLREAKREPADRGRDVRPRVCVPIHGPASELARDSMAQQTLRPPSGLSWAATTASTGRLVSTVGDHATPAAPTIALTSRGRASRAIALPRTEQLRLAAPFRGCGSACRGRALGDRARHGPRGQWSGCVGGR